MAGIRDSIFAEAKETGGMFFVIPSIVMLDEALPLSAKVLYGTITWKCGKRSCTWATNRELGEPIGLSAKRVSALLSLLEKLGHVETELEYKDGTHEILRRYIYPIMKSGRDLPGGTPPPENEDTSPSVQGTPSSDASIPPLENEEVKCNIKKDKQDKEDPPYSPPKGDAPPPESVPEDKPAPRRRTRQKKSIPTHAPERFEQFWAVYPVGGSRLKAVEAWDALAPSEELIDEMAQALKRQMRTRAWRDGIGIPHACRWLSNQRWTDKLPEEPAPQNSGSWADDPEVPYG